MARGKCFLLILVLAILWWCQSMLCYAGDVRFSGTMRLKRQKIADEVWACEIVVCNESGRAVLMQPDVAAIMVVEKISDRRAEHYFCFGWNDAKPFDEFPPQTVKQTSVLLDESCLKKIQQQNSETYVLIPYKLHGQDRIFNASIKVSFTRPSERIESKTSGDGDK